MLSVLALFVLAPPVKPPFDAVIKAHTKLDTGKVSLTADVKGKEGNTRLQYEIEYQRPGKARLVMKAPNTGTWTIWLDGNVCQGYDDGNDEFFSKTIVSKESLFARLTALLGSLDDSLQIVLTPSEMSRLFTPLRRVTNWKRTSPQTYVCQAPSGRCELKVDPKTYLLMRFKLARGADGVEWTYRYGGQPTFTKPIIPETATKVSTFNEKRLAPTWLDEQSKTTSQATILAYARLKSLECKISVDSTDYVLSTNGSKMRLETKDWTWIYDGEMLLVMFPQTKKMVRQKVALGDVATILSKLNIEVDGLIWQLALRQNPMKKLLLPAAHVRFLGTMGDAPDDSSLVEIKNKQLQIVVTIRERDHLIESINTSFLDSAQAKIGEVKRKMTYIRVNEQGKGDLFDTSEPPGYTPTQNN